MGRLKTGQERQRKKEIKKEHKKLAKIEQRKLWAAQAAAKRLKEKQDGQV